MSYDADSFKAGFALGRMLWRPPQDTNIAPDIGWTADPEYLVSTAGIELVQYGGGSSRTPYIKQTNGLALCCVVTNLGPVYSQYWTGPLLISTDKNYVRYMVGDMLLLESNTISYLGLTFYLNRDYWNSPQWSGGDQTPVTSFPVFDASGYSVTASDMTSVALAIMQAANVRLTGGGT